MIDNIEEFIPKLIELSIKHNFLIMEDRKLNDISYIVNMQYKKFRKNKPQCFVLFHIVSHFTLIVSYCVSIVSAPRTSGLSFLSTGLKYAD